MDFENRRDIWQGRCAPLVRCAKPRRDGLKLVRACGEQIELDVRTLLCARGKAFPISMLSSRMRYPKCGSREVTVRLTLPGSVLAAAAAKAASSQ